MNNLTYLQTHYFEQNELCKLANISLEKLAELIDNELIPNASYTQETKHTITSPLGDKTEVIEVKKYFAKSTLELIKNNLNSTSEDFKAQMKADYIKAVKNYDADNLLYQSDTELEELFATRWQFFLKGVYGICTLHSTPEEIAKKGIVVQKLIQLMENRKNLSLEDVQQQLKQLNDDYNAVATTFAPYQRESSSRGKYLDSQLKANGLGDLVKAC